MCSRSLASCLVALAWLGCGSEAPPPSTLSAIGACDVPASSTCTQYGTGDPAQRELARAGCAAQEGHFGEGACPTADVVATCAATPAGDVTYYYASGGHPYTAETGQAACTAATATPHQTTTVSAPAADAISLDAWCNASSAWICEHCRASEPRDACVLEESARCLPAGYPPSTLLSRPRAALDRCMADLASGTCGARPASCRPPPVAPGASLSLAQFCPEIASVRCERCEAGVATCAADHCPLFDPTDPGAPVGTLGDLERCLDLARTSACDAPAPEGCHGGWSTGTVWSTSMAGLHGS